MQHKSLLSKIFEKEKKGVQDILNNIKYSDLKIFEKLCKQSLISLKNKKKIIFLVMVVVQRMRNIWLQN